jgi:translation initiation factor 1
MGANNNWKGRLGVVYSTNAGFEFQNKMDNEAETLPPSKQVLKIQLSTKHRKGKTVTLITGFIGKEKDLKLLEKELKAKCATGGSSKDNEIIIQGNFMEKAGQYLRSLGYKIKGIGIH